jgi:hypothetical protein
MFLPWRLGHPLGQLRRLSSYNSCMWWRRRRSSNKDLRTKERSEPSDHDARTPYTSAAAASATPSNRRHRHRRPSTALPPRRRPLVAASYTLPSTNYLLVRRPPLPQPYMSIIGESLMYPASAMSNKLGQFCHLDGVASNLFVYNCKLDMEKICLGNTQTKVIMHLMAVTPQNRNNILEGYHTTTSYYRHTHKKKK